MKMQPDFNQQDQKTWYQLYSQQTPLREKQMVSEFVKGLQILEMNALKIPDIQNVNRKLKALTGWQAVYTQGFVEAIDFFKMLSEKKFPIGNFIRDSKDLSYTPEPDVFHDLYGHIPFYTDLAYADFCQSFGTRALKYSKSSQIIEEFQRLFWFTVEFALLKTSAGTKIFGAGIASSFSECQYALSEGPHLQKFDLEVIRNKSFRIDVMQDELILLDSVGQLYSCLPEFENGIQKEKL